MNNSAKIVVAGGGAFGTALAIVLGERAGSNVTLLLRDETNAQEIRTTRVNQSRLPDIKVPNALEISTEMSSLKDCDIVLSVVPTKAQYDFAQQANAHLKSDAIFVICSKGFDVSSGQLISTMIAEVLDNNPLAVLSGPGFAADIARHLPTAMTIAADDIKTAEALSTELSRKSFRLYASDDLIGVQTGGALKNVLAIAAGIVVGAKLGDSARASLIARGLAELSRYIKFMGGRAETAAGLSGLGDLVLTASSEQSRNYRYGIEIGRGAKPSDLVGEGKPLVEGANAALAASELGKAKDIPMPITNSVADIIKGRVNVAEAVEQLMTRPLRSEPEK